MSSSCAGYIYHFVTLANRVAQGKLSDASGVSKRSIKVSATPASEISNNLLVNYALNVSTGQYEGQLRLNRHNHTLCKHSYYRYGETAEKALNCPDVMTQGDAWIVGDRYLSVFSHRHELVSDHDVACCDGFDIVEGDAVNLDLPEAGWTAEKCILLQRSYMADRIRQTFWRVGISS